MVLTQDERFDLVFRLFLNSRPKAQITRCTSIELQTGQINPAVTAAIDADPSLIEMAKRGCVGLPGGGLIELTEAVFAEMKRRYPD